MSGRRVAMVVGIVGLSIAARPARSGTVCGPDGTCWSGGYSGTPTSPGDGDDHHREGNGSDDHPSGPPPPSWQDNQGRKTNDRWKGVKAYQRAQEAWKIKDEKHLDLAIAGFSEAHDYGIDGADEALAKAWNAKAVLLFDLGQRVIDKGRSGKGLSIQEVALALVIRAQALDPGNTRYRENRAEMQGRMNDLWCDAHKPLMPHDYAGANDDFHATARAQCLDKSLAAQNAGWSCSWTCVESTGDEGDDW